MPNEMTTTEKKASMKLEVVDRLFTLMLSAFGLVAALAWNEAIQGLFKSLFGEQSGLVAKFVYAGGITVVIVLVTIQFGRVSEHLKRNLDSKEN